MLKSAETGQELGWSATRRRGARGACGEKRWGRAGRAGSRYDRRAREGGAANQGQVEAQSLVQQQTEHRRADGRACAEMRRGGMGGWIAEQTEGKGRRTGGGREERREQMSGQ